MKRLLVITAILLALPLGLVLKIVLKGPPGRPAVRVSFAGFTNGAAGKRLAVFAVSNASPQAVVRQAHYSIIQPGAGGRSAQAGEGWFPNGGGTVHAGECERVVVEAPAVSGPWGVALLVRQREGMVHGIATELLLEAQKRGFPTRYRRAGFSVKSDWAPEGL